MNIYELEGVACEFAADRMKRAKDHAPKSEESNAALEQAIDAAKLCTEIAKIREAREEQEKNEKLKAKEVRIDRMIKAAEIVGLILVAPTVKYLFDKRRIVDIGLVERMESFTSTPGRALGKMFDFGK